MCTEFDTVGNCRRCGLQREPLGRFTVSGGYVLPSYGSEKIAELYNMLGLFEYQKKWLEDYNNNSRIILKPTKKIRGQRANLIIMDDPLDNE